MSKKHLKRKEPKLSPLGMEINEDLLCIGVVLKNLSMSELNRQCFTSINDICKNCCGVDFCIIPHDFDVSPLLLCPVIDPRILKQWTYPIVSTSVSTTKTALSSKSDHIYFYILDVEHIPEDIVNNKRVTLIASNANIADSFKIEIIENFDMKKFVSLINKDLKNEEERSNRAITV